MENEKNIDAFEKDCETILLENSDLDTLFSLTDNLLNYSLEKEFNVEYITRQLEIIGGKVFSNVVTFCLDLTVDDCRAVLNSSKIDINLRQKIMFLVAKYSMIYSQIKEKNNNELGWSYAKYNIIDIGDNYFLELKLHLKGKNRYRVPKKLSYWTTGRVFL